MVQVPRFWAPGKPQFFPRPWHKIIPRRRTMEIEKIMKEVTAGVNGAYAFSRLICQGSYRSVPSTSYHLINPPTPTAVQNSGYLFDLRKV